MSEIVYIRNAEGAFVTTAQINRTPVWGDSIFVLTVPFSLTLDFVACVQLEWREGSVWGHVIDSDAAATGHITVCSYAAIYSKTPLELAAWDLVEAAG